MDTINQKTTRMPGVTHDPSSCVFFVIGEAYPEDVIATFEPIIDRLSAILSSPHAHPTEIRFELQYFNSGSSRKILEIIRLISSAAVGHKILWVADPEDDEIVVVVDPVHDNHYLDTSFAKPRERPWAIKPLKMHVKPKKMKML